MLFWNIRGDFPAIVFYVVIVNEAWMAAIDDDTTSVIAMFFVIASDRSKPKPRAKGVAGGNCITAQPVIARERSDRGNCITTHPVIASD